MGHPEWRGILSAVERTEAEEAAAAVEAQINAEVPRSRMGAGERERRRELARKWAEKHHWQVMEEKEVRSRTSSRTMKFKILLISCTQSAEFSCGKADNSSRGKR